MTLPACNLKFAQDGIPVALEGKRGLDVQPPHLLRINRGNVPHHPLHIICTLQDKTVPPSSAMGGHACRYCGTFRCRGLLFRQWVHVGIITMLISTLMSHSVDAFAYRHHDVLTAMV